MKNLIGFAIALSAVAASPEPGYNVSTVIDVTATVVKVREVPKDQAFAGLHLILQKDSQTLDIYVGPTEFVKVFDVVFIEGDVIHVTGSRVEFEGSMVVLAREVSLGTITLVCRDKDGAPLWKYFIKPPVG
jgi:DNA/RNA endonuclease YhcR with UshA esterase domain